MQTKTLDSSFLTEASYDNNENLLTVSFSNGQRYQYRNVGSELYEGLVAAESAGRFFRANIQNLPFSIENS